MAGYMVYWPKDQIKKLKKAKDSGPISVLFGSIHSKMPSIAGVKVGDIMFPVTLDGGFLYVVGRLPIEKIEPAYDYLVRELGNQCGALVPDGVDQDAYYNTPLLPHKEHQRPFNCCSQTAAQGSHGSTIEPRQIPKEVIPVLLFGPTKSKQKPLRLDKNGNPTVNSLTSTRRMSDETFAVFDSLFSARLCTNKVRNHVGVIQVMEEK